MKRLVFCFDGTWNRLDAPCPTNVVITAESVLPLASDNTAQLIYYDEGVGTGRLDRLRGGLFGTGLVQNLADAYRFLIFNYTPGDEIYLFGFSRGAYTARSFAGLLSNCGVLLRRHAARVDEAIERYRTKKQTPEGREELMRFRGAYSPRVCVSADEDRWRAAQDAEYAPGKLPMLRVKYLGVWDTVGALGIPARFKFAAWVNKKHEFHDTELSDFVQCGWHAVAVDERRVDFVPTLWTNLAELNERAGKKADAVDAPYQQRWFPGTHSSVGGGGERRGLSDQALSWLWDGARMAGLELDASEDSRVFELQPDYAEYADNLEKPGLLYRLMNSFGARDRQDGPQHAYEVSMSARRRWHEDPAKLRDRARYRPVTLARAAGELDAIDPATLGLGAPGKDAERGTYKLYQVKRNDTLSKIAQQFYGDARAFPRIYQANLDKLENPHRIFVGQMLKIPA